MSDQQTISIPSLLLLAAFTALTIRYFFFNKSSSSSTSSSSIQSRHGGANPADVEQIATMFPQLGRREIMWDLRRNGGSVAATTERVLGRGGLDTPPPSFQPALPAPATPSTAGTNAGQSKSEHIDLITRYNLAGKVGSPPSKPEESIGGSGPLQGQKVWSNNKDERQALFQRRREEMVLNARRKLEEKESERKKQGV